MGALRYVGILWAGQSNQQGAGLTDNGALAERFTSAYTGQVEPLLGNGNGGGSCLPLLIDLGLKRGVKFIIYNSAVGGAAIQHFTGVVGATVSGGSAATPVAGMNMSGVGLAGGTGVVAVEGQPDFDPFNMLGRMRTFKATYPQITEWVGTFANAESNSGTATAYYQAALVSIGDFFLASGCNAYLPGLSSNGNNSAASMDALSAGVTGAITEMRAQGKPVFRGGDLYARFGMGAPLTPEASAPSTKVHLPGKGQRVHAELWDRALMAAGF